MRTFFETSEWKYWRTHPWLTFELRLGDGPRPALWMALGEACSKCEHIAGIPLLPSVSRKLHELYLAKGVRGTTAIEGNTLTEQEVAKRLEGKLSLPPSKEYLGQEVDNVVSAANDILGEVTNSANDEKAGISLQDIQRYNAMVLQGLDLGHEVVPGQIRTYPAGVGRYTGAPPEDCEHLLERLCGWLNENWLPGGHPIAEGVLKATVGHLYFVWIHPFGDGNGRTARLIEYRLLIEAGVPSPAAHLLSNFYNETREEYYRRLDDAVDPQGGVLAFVEYALRGFTDGLKEQLDLVRVQQEVITWRGYVNDKFQDMSSTVDMRRRNLVLDLTSRGEPVPRSGIRQVSPRIAEAYAGKGARTVSRDLNTLVEMGLIERVQEGYRPRVNSIAAFLPVRRNP